jgi:probable HAF family extracellular repeat protein
LGTLGGMLSSAAAVNIWGQVTGSSATADGITHAFLWDSKNGMQDLGTLGGANSYANGINAAGHVVGGANFGANPAVYHAFFYADGQMTDLGTLGGNGSVAGGINNHDWVVGSADRLIGLRYAFLYDGVRMRDLGTLGGRDSSGSGINAAGQAVGTSPLDQMVPHAFLYSDGAMTDLGAFDGGIVSYGAAINDLGEVVGEAALSVDPPVLHHAFLFSDGQMNDLGALPGFPNSSAYGLNNTGDVVGSCDGTAPPVEHAFLYSGGTMADLNDLIPGNSGWVLTRANAINNAAQIVGYGTNPDGLRHAFLLTPDAGNGLQLRRLPGSALAPVSAAGQEPNAARQWDCISPSTGSPLIQPSRTDALPPQSAPRRDVIDIHFAGGKSRHCDSVSAGPSVLLELYLAAGWPHPASNRCCTILHKML